MKSITSKSSKNWLIATDDDTHSPEESAIVIDDLLKIFISLVPINIERSMIIIENPDGPIYLSNHQMILLNTASSYHFSQIVYQLAHELCHFAINEGIQQSEFKWFEESLCDLSSHYFLKSISDYWSESISKSKKNYAPNFIEYTKNAKKKITKINLHDLSNSNTTVCKYLSSERYDRKINTFVALKLLPIFESDPNLWKAVPLLQYINTTNSFIDFLISWKNCSPEESKTSITKIIHQFE